MAVDEALLRSYQSNPEMPVFRLYGWSSPTVSLGRFQQYDDDIFPGACAQAGVPLVRRITGGGAIYHDHEITYSLVCSRDDLGKMSVKESYRKLCGFLIELYQGFGIDARFALDRFPDDDSIGRKTVHCFAGREAYDIITPHGKLGGNAQRRLGQLVFQHGSIPFSLRLDKQRALFAEHALPAPDTVVGLYDAAACDVSELTYSNVGRRISTAFANVMDISWVTVPLTESEQREADILQQQKYSSSTWNIDIKDLCV